MRVPRRFWAALSVVAAASLASTACVGGSKGLSAEDKDRLKPYILDVAPADIPHKLDVNFENKVHLIGYKFDPETAHPGQEVKLTYYWRCDDSVEDGWMLFTHTRDDGNQKLGNLDNVGPLREIRNGSHQELGPERWEKGKVYVDEQTYEVPKDVAGSTVTIMVGVWKGDARLRIISGPNDGDNSAIVGTIKTGKPGPAEAQEHTANDVPAMTVNKLAATGKITIDGKGEEPEWGGAGSTGPFVNVGTGKPDPTVPAQGSAKVLWDDQNLYILVQAEDADPFVGFTNKSQTPDAKAGKLWTAAGQPKLWTKDTIEMMLEPDALGTSTNYYELQIGPQNKVFKSQFDTLQMPKGDPDVGPFGHEDWDPKIKSAVTLQKGPDGKVTGYTVEAAIPWAAYTKAANHPPKAGEVWRVNFYAMKENAGTAWSPILGQGNFHFAKRFGKIVWAVPGAAPAMGGVGGVGGMGTDGGAPLLGIARPHFPMHGPMVHMPMPQQPAPNP